MSELLELAERCEKAVVPDRELGFEILLACGWRKTCVGNFYGPLWYWNDGAKRSYPEDRLPCPTSSIDAASALLPAPLYWMMAKGRNRPGEPLYAIQIIDPETRTTVALSESERLEGCICAAALRARASLVSPSQREGK